MAVRILTRLLGGGSFPQRVVRMARRGLLLLLWYHHLLVLVLLVLLVLVLVLVLIQVRVLAGGTTPSPL